MIHQHKSVLETYTTQQLTTSSTLWVVLSKKKIKMIFMHVILKVLMVAALKITAIREAMPCSLLDVYWAFQRNLLPL
jgi:hypothetical protein